MMVELRSEGKREERARYIGAAMPSVTVENVSKHFGVPAVDGVSLTGRRRLLLKLLGPSGCGKTTTLRMIAGGQGALACSAVVGSPGRALLVVTDQRKRRPEDWMTEAEDDLVRLRVDRYALVDHRVHRGAQGPGACQP